MAIGVLFWVLWVLCLLFGGGVYWRADVAGRYVGGTWLIVLILLGLLGWHVFGPILK